MKPYSKPRKAQKKPEKPARDWFDIVGMIVGICGVIGIVATLWIGQMNQADNGRDMANALNDMATIANSMSSEKPLMETQAKASVVAAQAAQRTADASASQSRNFGRQTAAVVAQTGAITRSAQASIAAAQAQSQAANLTISTQRPKLNLKEYSLIGFDNPPDKDGMVIITSHWVFDNTGGSAAIVKSFGFNYLIGGNLPETPAIIQMHPGNDVVVANTVTGGFTTTQNDQFLLTKESAVAIGKGGVPVYFIGRIDFADYLGAIHVQCFAYLITIKDGRSTYYAPAGGAAYHCDT